MDGNKCDTATGRTLMYCKKIDCVDIEKSNNQSIEETLNNCELKCNRYYQCDTVAFMEDELKRRNEMQYDKED